MKRLLPILLSGVLAGLFPTSVTARVLSPTEALERVGSDESVPAQSGLRKAASRLVLRQTVATPVTEEPAMYIFAPAAGNGFILASADDTYPAVLGYGDEYSAFDPEDIAPGFSWYLETVAYNMQMVRDGNATYDAASGYNSSWTAVSPLIKTTWAQGAPFNYNVMYYSSSNSKTGCVPTAMSQIMYYWQYPAKGTGSNSYKDDNGHSISMNFANTTFEWSKMKTYYSSSDNIDNAQKAVATLMKACGASVEANYKSGSTGAQTVRVVHALTKYFGYSKSIRYNWRNFGFGTDGGEERWETLVYESLSKGRPVIYAGKKENSNSGHAFICDGYSTDGKFHFNWGWRGTSDGYFALNVLNPNVSKGYIYNWRQFCITDIVPATKVENESDYSLQTPFIGFDGNLTWGKYPDDSTVGNCLYANDGSTRKVLISNMGHDNIQHDLHIALIPWQVEEHYKRFKARRYIIKTVENCDWVAGDGGVYYVNGIPSRLEGVPYWTYDVKLMYTRKNAASASSLDFASGEPEYVIPSDNSRGQVYMDVYEDGSWKIDNSIGGVTGVSDITVDETVSGAVRRVVAVNGVTVAVNPTAEELSALPAGFYLYVYDNGTRKVGK